MRHRADNIHLTGGRDYHLSSASHCFPRCFSAVLAAVFGVFCVKVSTGGACAPFHSTIESLNCAKLCLNYGFDASVSRCRLASTPQRQRPPRTSPFPPLIFSRFYAVSAAFSGCLTPFRRQRAVPSTAGRRGGAAGVPPSPPAALFPISCTVACCDTCVRLTCVPWPLGGVCAVFRRFHRSWHCFNGRKRFGNAASPRVW